MEGTRISLVLRLRDPADQSAWAEFYRLYAGVILHYARGRGLGPEAAEDVLQETLVALVRQLPAFEYDRRRGLFRNYILTIVHRKSLDAIRRSRRAVLVPLDGSPDDDGHRSPVETLVGDDGQAPIEAVEAEWRRAIFAQALVRLRANADIQPRTFEVFQAYAISGEACADVARRFGLEGNAVYQIRNRMISMLQDEVNSLLKEWEGVT